MGDLGDLSSNGRIEAVLDGVVGSALEQLGDLRPPIAQSRVRFHDYAILRGRPRTLSQIGRQLVEPTLTRLLARATGDVRRDRRPPTCPVARHKRREQCVLFLAPRPLDLPRCVHVGDACGSRGARSGRGCGDADAVDGRRRISVRGIGRHVRRRGGRHVCGRRHEAEMRVMRRRVRKRRRRDDVRVRRMCGAGLRWRRRHRRRAGGQAEKMEAGVGRGVTKLRGDRTAGLLRSAHVRWAALRGRRHGDCVHARSGGRFL